MLCLKSINFIKKSQENFKYKNLSCNVFLKIVWLGF